MAFLSREFIAVPDDRKDQIVYKWPDVSIRKMTRAIVNADQMAVFINTGQVVGVLGPGRHEITADEIPGLGILIDAATGGRAYRAELYFVGTREYATNPFGGRIDDVQDPQTGLIVTLRVFGDYAMRVLDAPKLITNLLGTVDVADNGAVTTWINDQLLKVMRTNVTTQVVRNGWPILGLSAYTPDIESEAIASANEQLDRYGIAITKMGNFDINLAPEDEERLKTIAKDTSYSRLAGSFNQYAAGEAALGAGAGMAQGGGGGMPIMMAGMGMGQVAANQPSAPSAPPPSGAPGGGGTGYEGPPPGAPTSAPAPPAPPPAPGLADAVPPVTGAGATGVACIQCGTVNPVGTKFCPECGTPSAPPVIHCANCQSEITSTTKFCPECGTPTAPAAAPPGPA